MKFRYQKKKMFFILRQIPLKLYFMKYSERKVSQCILAFIEFPVLKDHNVNVNEVRSIN